MEAMIRIMKKYDFSEMETLVYTTLLEKGILTGYEVSKQSGVARSKVYNILEKLVKKNLVIVNKSEPKMYYAVSSDEFLERLEKDVQSDIHFLTQHLGDIKEQPEEEMLWKLEGYQNIMLKVEHLVKNASESVLIQIWQEDLTEHLLTILQEAEKNVKHFVLILFSQNHEYDIPLKNVYIHGFESEKKNEFGSRWLNIVVDEEEVVFGTISDDKILTDVTWSKNNAMVSLAKEYVKHDAYTLKIIEELPNELISKYGDSFGEIRAIY